jgi:hypothetical protein
MIGTFFIFAKEDTIPKPELLIGNCYLPSINKFTIFPESSGIYVEYAGFFQSDLPQRDFCLILPFPSAVKEISLFNASETLVREKDKLLQVQMDISSGVQQLHGGFFLQSELGEISWRNERIQKNHAAFFILIAEYTKGITKNFLEKIFNYVNSWPPTVILRSKNLKTFVTDEPFGVKKDKSHHLDKYRMIISVPEKQTLDYPNFLIKGLYYDEFYFFILLASFIVFFLCIFLFLIFKKSQKKV